MKTLITYRINDEPAQTWMSEDLPPVIGIVARENQATAMFHGVAMGIVCGDRGKEPLQIEAWLDGDDQSGPPRWRHGHNSNDVVIEETPAELRAYLRGRQQGAS